MSYNVCDMFKRLMPKSYFTLNIYVDELQCMGYVQTVDAKVILHVKHIRAKVILHVKHIR